MGVWACSGGSLRFGARLSQEVLDTLVEKLASEVENGHLERQDEGMHSTVVYVDDDDDDEGAVSLEDLNNRLDFWLRMHRVKRKLLVMVAGTADPGSPLRLLDGKPELLKMIFRPLMPEKAPTLQSLLEKVEKAAGLTAAQDDGYFVTGTAANDKTVVRCIHDFGAEPDVEIESLPAWQRQRALRDQLHSLYRARYPLDVEIDFVTTFEGYGEEFRFYIFGVPGKQDMPHFSGEKKLSSWDGDCSGIDFCAPIGMFSPPEGAADKIAAAIEALRGSGMLPAEPTAAEMADMHAKGLIIMPNLPRVAQVGWNVVGHSHVG